jgi:shikimate dehydrogenase
MISTALSNWKLSMSAQTGKAILAGVMGYPIAHSLSPALHEYWLALHNIDGAYIPLHVSPENLASTLKLLPDLGFKGFNVTLPHKESLVYLVGGMDDTATMIGAINTIIVQENGALFGTNTDAYGFIQNLKTELNKKSILIDFATRHCLVLGAGGAAKAIIVALMQEGCKNITICNRSYERAVTLKESLKVFPAFDSVSIILRPWEERDTETDQPIDLLINTTQLGMVGQPVLDYNLASLVAHCIVTDIVYNPLTTKLLEDAETLGLVTIDGLGMLLWQAQKGFHAWFGVRPEITDALRQHVLKSKSP